MPFIIFVEPIPQSDNTPEEGGVTIPEAANSV
jgi:hypothetical protein